MAGAKGYTPLTLALAEIDCHAGVDFQLVTLLVEKGADVNKHASINGGTTPLMESAMSLDVQSAEYLLRKGADANAVDVEGRPALMHFSNDGSDRPRKIVEALLRGRSRCAGKIQDGHNAEAWATELRRPDIAEIIRNAEEK
jgi:ankyrin repeat protein